MYASIEMLRGRGIAYAGPITRRISTTSLQNPKFLRPEIRSGLKQRQEGRRVAPTVRRDPVQQQRQSEEQYQRAYQESENARRTKEQQLDDIQKRLQERVKQRQRRTDRWIPPRYAEDAVSQRAKEEQARAAAREARRQQEKERLRQEASDAAVAAQFLQGRVRQKTSRFADLVENLQESKQNKDPYQSRREDDGITVQMSEQQRQQRRRERRRQQQEVVGNSPYTKDYDTNRDIYDPQEKFSNLPADVVRVQRGVASSSQVVAEVVVESVDDDEEPFMVWTAGSEGLFQEPMRATLEEAEYTDIEVEEYSMEEEEKERKFKQQQRGRQSAAATKREFSTNSSDEYIDW